MILKAVSNNNISEEVLQSLCETLSTLRPPPD